MLTETAPTPIFRRTQWCESAAKSDGKQLDGDRSDWHIHCPIATRQPVRPKGASKDTPAVLTVCICSCTCHVTGTGATVPPIKCVDCGNTDEAELDSSRWVCLDRVACETRVDQRVVRHPLGRELRECRQAGERDRAANRLAREQRRGNNPMADSAPGTEQEPKQPRERKPPKPKVGACHHCGEPTKGGQFVTGHDAKLKGDLQRVAVDPHKPESDRVLAIAEQEARGWHKVDAARKVVTKNAGAFFKDNNSGKAPDPAQLTEQQTELGRRYDALIQKAKEQLNVTGPDQIIANAVKERTGK